MSPEQLQEFNQMKADIASLRDLYNMTLLPSANLYETPIISKDRIVAEGNGIKITSRLNPTGVEIRTGAGNTDASIKAEVGTLPSGSLYFSSDPLAPVFFNLNGTWLLLNLP